MTTLSGARVLRSAAAGSVLVAAAWSAVVANAPLAAAAAVSSTGASGPAHAVLPAAPGGVTLVSATPAGVNGNGYSFTGGTRTVSADGRYVLFGSHATNLAPRDRSGDVDVYRKDLRTGAVLLVSVWPNGTAMTAGGGSISADGNIVAFNTFGSRILVKDLRRNTVTAVPRRPDGGRPNGRSGPAVLSADGRRVAFYSTATDLDPRDRDPGSDVYVADVATGRARLASVYPDGRHPSLASRYGPYGLDLSADGSTVAFATASTQLDRRDSDAYYDIYVKNLRSGALTLASTRADGVKGNGDSDAPSLSADGRFLAFQSCADNFGLPYGGEEYCTAVYRKDLRSGALSLISQLADSPVISADGSRIAYTEGYGYGSDPRDTNQAFDVYAYDVTTGRRVYVSTTPSAGGNAESETPSISADGSTVAFTSIATNLAPVHHPHDQWEVYARRITW